MESQHDPALLSSFIVAYIHGAPEELGDSVPHTAPHTAICSVIFFCSLHVSLLLSRCHTAFATSTAVLLPFHVATTALRWDIAADSNFLQPTPLKIGTVLWKEHEIHR